MFCLLVWICLLPEWSMLLLLLLLFFFFFFLGLHLRHTEVPGLLVKSELLLLAYATARATLDPSCICNLCHSLQ